MKTRITMSVAGVLLAGWSGVAVAQQTLAPHTFEVTKASGQVSIMSADNKTEAVKPGSVYDIGATKEVDPAARLNPAAETEKTAPDITGFKVLAMDGLVDIKSPKGKTFAVAKLDTPYKLGSTVKTGRSSFADLELSPKNQVRVLAKSEVQVGMNIKHPLIISLKLQQGKVDSKLDNFPKDHLFQVQTPVGICGAVGTAYTVNQEMGDHSSLTTISVSDGVVVLDGRFVRTIGAGLSAGQSLEITVEEKEKSRDVTVTFSGKPGDTITVEVWGRQFTLTVPPAVEGQPAVVNASVSLRMNRDELGPNLDIDIIDPAVGSLQRYTIPSLDPRIDESPAGL